MQLEARNSGRGNDCILASKLEGGNRNERCEIGRLRHVYLHDIAVHMTTDGNLRLRYPATHAEIPNLGVVPCARLSISDSSLTAPSDDNTFVCNWHSRPCMHTVLPAQATHACTTSALLSLERKPFATSCELQSDERALTALHCSRTSPLDESRMATIESSPLCNHSALRTSKVETRAKSTKPQPRLTTVSAVQDGNY